MLVKPVEVETQSKGGIIIPTTVAEKEDLATMFGHCVEIGPVPFGTESEPRCNIGDYIIFAKYAGQLFKGDDGVTYRLINMTDVIAVKDYNANDAVINGASRKESAFKVSMEDLQDA